MSDCIFCKIVAGDIPAYRIYEDEKSVAFLDINPVSDGHTLLIPKQHHEKMIDTPDALVGELFVRVKKLMPAIKKAMSADFVAVSVVGVDVPHFHIHLIPRKSGDGLADFWPTKKYEEGQGERITEKIKQEL